MPLAARITVPICRRRRLLRSLTPILEYAITGAGSAYRPDGRPRRFSNDAIGFWQSRCFLEGKATCTTCHRDPHEPDIDRNPSLVPTNNAICSSCHAEVVAAGARHTRHAAGSSGSACVSCHMPRTVINLRARMPDHTISVPAPENTVSHAIPNACNECHQVATPPGLPAGWPNGFPGDAAGA